MLSRFVINAAMLLLIGVALTRAAAMPASAETIRVGIFENQHPYYQLQRETGEPSGFAIDAIIRIASDANLAVSFVRFESMEQLLAAAQRNTIDVVPVLPDTVRTRQGFVFVGTLQETKLSLFTRNDNTQVRSKSDLLGRRVSFVRHGPAQKFMRDFRGELSIPHATADDVLSAVVAGTSDAGILQEEIGFNHARELGVASLVRVSDEPITEVRLGFAINANRPDLQSRLQSSVQRYLASENYRQDRSTWLSDPDESFDLRKILTIIGLVFLATIVGLALWRYFSVMRLNKELDHAVQETQAAENRFRDYAAAAADWFFETDAQHRFTFFSPRYAEAVGLTRDDIMGKTPLEAHADQRVAGNEQGWNTLEKCLAQEEDWQDVTFDLDVFNGEHRTVSMSARAVRGEAGAFVGYRGVGRNITARVTAERALHQARKMESVGQLTGGIAHDFNNLLTVLVGNIELLRKRVKDDAISSGYLDTASSATTLGAELTQRLLGFSRRQTLDPKHVDLDASVGSFVPLIERTLGKDIQVRIDLEAGNFSVMVDESQLQNVLLNLSINARDAMPTGGTLTLSTSIIVDRDPKHGAPDGSPQSSFVRLTIEDTGVGIAPEHLERVVEPFFTTKDVGEGTGLGLSMAYGFARQSGGHLTIESRPDEGTSVFLDLPAFVSTRNAPDTEDEMPELIGGTETILVVDDEPDVRNITARRLESLGYAVLEAADGPAALEELRTPGDGPDIDLVLTDVIMPHGMSGIEMIAQARTMRPNMRVVFASGHTKEDLLDDDRENWLQKPYSLPEMADKVRKALDR